MFRMNLQLFGTGGSRSGLGGGGEKQNFWVTFEDFNGGELKPWRVKQRTPEDALEKAKQKIKKESEELAKVKKIQTDEEHQKELAKKKEERDAERLRKEKERADKAEQRKEAKEKRDARLEKKRKKEEEDITKAIDKALKEASVSKEEREKAKAAQEKGAAERREARQKLKEELEKEKQARKDAKAQESKSKEKAQKPSKPSNEDPTPREIFQRSFRSALNEVNKREKLGRSADDFPSGVDFGSRGNLNYSNIQGVQRAIKSYEATIDKQLKEGKISESVAKKQRKALRAVQRGLMLQYAEWKERTGN